MILSGVSAAAVFSNFVCRRKQTFKLRAQPILTDGGFFVLVDGMEVAEIERSTFLPDERWQ